MTSEDRATYKVVVNHESNTRSGSPIARTRRAGQDGGQGGPEGGVPGVHRGGLDGHAAAQPQEADGRGRVISWSELPDEASDEAEASWSSSWSPCRRGPRRGALLVPPGRRATRADRADARRARSARPGPGRAAAGARAGGRARPAALSARPGVHRRVLRLPVRGGRGRPRLCAAAEPADDPARDNRRGRPAGRRAHVAGAPRGRGAVVGGHPGTRGRRGALLRRRRPTTRRPIAGSTRA